MLATLRGIARLGSSHLCWTGTLRSESDATYRRRRLQRVKREAGVDGFHLHKVRHALAIELPLAGTMIQEVSTMLGHSSVIITERYYFAWDRSRHSRLEGFVRAANRLDRALAQLDRGTALKKPAGTDPTGPRGKPPRRLENASGPTVA